MNAIAGLPAFLAYVAVAFGLIAFYLLVYLALTSHREIALIRAGNAAAATALGGSLVGYATPLAVAMYESGSLLDVLIWGLIALLVQISVYGLTWLLLPDLSARIARGNNAAGILLAATSLAGGLINATAMTT